MEVMFTCSFCTEYARAYYVHAAADNVLGPGYEYPDPTGAVASPDPPYYLRPT